MKAYDLLGQNCNTQIKPRLDSCTNFQRQTETTQGHNDSLTQTSNGCKEDQQDLVFAVRHLTDGTLKKDQKKGNKCSKRQEDMVPYKGSDNERR